MVGALAALAWLGALWGLAEAVPEVKAGPGRFGALTERQVALWALVAVWAAGWKLRRKVRGLSRKGPLRGLGGGLGGRG